MRKELPTPDPENPDACLFVGHDGTEWYCENFADYLFTWFEDSARWAEQEDAAMEAESLRASHTDHLYGIQDRLSRL